MNKKYILPILIVFFIFISGCISPTGELDTNFSSVESTDSKEYSVNQTVLDKTDYMKNNETLKIINDSNLQNNTKIYEKSNFSTNINISNYSTEQLIIMYNLSILDYTTPEEISNNSNFLDVETIKSVNNNSNLRLYELVRTSNVSISRIVDKDEVINDISNTNYKTINTSKYSILPTPKFELYNMSLNPIGSVTNKTVINVNYPNYENLSIYNEITNGTYHRNNITYNYTVYNTHIEGENQNYIANYIQSTYITDNDIVILTGLYPKNSNETHNIIELMEGTDVNNK